MSLRIRMYGEYMTLLVIGSPDRSAFLGSGQCRRDTHGTEAGLASDLRFIHR